MGGGELEVGKERITSAGATAAQRHTAGWFCDWPGINGEGPRPGSFIS